jgi:hopene-associated glycosyltransferase HpnB
VLLTFSTLIATVPLAIWLYLLFARGNFWRVRVDAIEPKPLAHWPKVVAIVPARNEADTIARTIASLASQDYPRMFSIVVVDDHSDDDTAALARKAANDSRLAHLVTVVRAAPLLSGWTGKVWALNEGIHASPEQEPDLYWFTDADIAHQPDTLRRLVFHAEQESLDLASLMVLLRTKTIPERFLMPAFLFFFLMLYPPRWIANPNKRTEGAAGGCLLLRRSALERIGGLGTICGEVIEDCALARAVKKTGGKIWLGLTRTSVGLRGFGSYAEIRDMIARTAFTQLRHSVLLLVATLICLFVTYLLAWVLLLALYGPARLLAGVAICLMTVSYSATIRFYRLPPLWALSLPVAAVFYGYATCVSAVRYWLGRGGQWKGRAQAPGSI